MEIKAILERFRAADPAALKDKYLAEGKKIVLTAPVYTPEEMIHSGGVEAEGARQEFLGGLVQAGAGFFGAVAEGVGEGARDGMEGEAGHGSDI